MKINNRQDSSLSLRMTPLKFIKMNLNKKQDSSLSLRMTPLILMFASIILYTPLPLYSATIGGKPGAFLSWGAGGRAMGMGMAGVASDNQTFSGYFNPALLSLSEFKQVGAFQSTLWEDTGYSFFGYVHPTIKRGVFGINYIQLLSAGAEKRDISNTLLGTFDFKQTAVVLNYATEISPVLSWGVSSKFINSSLDTYSQGFTSFDTGIFYIVRPGISAGANIQNMISFVSTATDDVLPMVFKLGASITVIPNKMLITADMAKNSVSGGLIDSYGIGFEFSLWRNLMLRIGKNSAETSFGFGFMGFDSLNIDYAVAMNPSLGNSNRVSLNYKFGDSAKIKMQEAIEQAKDEESSIRQLSEEELRQFQDAYQSAIESYKSGLFTNAIEQFNIAFKIDPTDTDLQLFVERLTIVVKILPQCISPGKVNELTRRGIAYFVDGFGENAVKTMAYGLSLEPENFALSRLLSRFEEYTKIKTDKIQPVQGMSLVDQKLYEILVNFRKKDFSRVIDLSKEILILEPDNLLAYKRLGSAFFALGDKDKAKEMWKKVLEYEPDPKLEKMIKDLEK